jgi:hypothetical protein
MQGWTADFGLSDRNIDMQWQDSSNDIMAFENIIDDLTPLVHVPQGVWDELFDKALQALDRAPMDEDPKF